MLKLLCNLIYSAFIQPETDLEKEVAELLQSSENYIKDQKVLTPAELKAVETMSLDEVNQAIKIQLN